MVIYQVFKYYAWLLTLADHLTPGSESLGVLDSDTQLSYTHTVCI
jgi:hypothetical protein